MNYDMRKQQVHGNQYNAGKDIHIAGRDIHITEIKAEDPLVKGRNCAEKGKKALARKEYATAQHLLENAHLLLAEKEAAAELAQVKYYLALSLLQGRMPFSCTLPNMRYIEELLRSAISLSPLHSYYHTLSLFKLDFARHGLRNYKSDALKLKQKALHKKMVQIDEENLRLLKLCQADLLRRFQSQ